jgi:hypothetical protein
MLFDNRTPSLLLAKEGEEDVHLVFLPLLLYCNRVHSLYFKTNY